MIQHLPPLVVVTPMLGACLVLLVRSPVWSRTLAALVAWGSFALSISLFLQVQAQGTISYHLGGWEPPWGIEYRIDMLNAVVLVLVSGMASVVLPYGPVITRSAAEEKRQHLFYATFLLALCGLLGIAATGDAFNVFVFLEISSLSTYILVGSGENRRALTAAFTYLVIGSIGGTFYLIGVGLLYAMTGTLNMHDLAVRLPALGDLSTVRAGLAFLLVGLSIKLAVFPVHQWLPNAYTYAPTKVTAFIASTATKVSLYAFIRVIFGIFGAAYVFDVVRVDAVLIPLSLTGIYVATLVAVYERDLKRMLAYSSVAQVGYMVLGVSLASVTGLTGGIVHLLNHALMKGGLFLAVGCLTYRLHSANIGDMRGIARDMPYTMAAFVVGGLSLIGVPLTVGFISKWYLVLGAVEQGRWVVAGAVLGSSLLSIFYIWKVIEIAYFDERPEGALPVREAPLGMLIPTWLLIGATVGFGVFTPWTAGVAEAAARALLGGG